LPWDHIDSGVSRDFLLSERSKAVAGEPTKDCRQGVCTGCGVCDFDQVRNHLATADAVIASLPGSQAVSETLAQAAGDVGQRIRVNYSKTGAMIFLSHLEMLTLFTRAVKRADIPVKYSQGFHPHPKFSFATALSVGVQSFAEYLDVEVSSGFDADMLKESLNRSLPEGVAVINAWTVPAKSPSLSTIMDRVRYRVTLPDTLAKDLEKAAGNFMALESSPFRRVKKNGPQEYDLRHELFNLSVTENSLTMEIGRGKPLEFVSAMTGFSIKELEDSRIEKLAVIFKDSSFI